MGAKVAATYLHWSQPPQPVVSHSPSALSPSSSSSSSSSSSYSFSYSRRRRRSRRGMSVSDGTSSSAAAAAPLLLRFVRSHHHHHRPPPPPLYIGVINLPRSRSCELSSCSSRAQSLRRSCSSAGSDAFFDEEFAESLEETAAPKRFADSELDASPSNPKSSSDDEDEEEEVEVEVEVEVEDGDFSNKRNHNSDFPNNSNNNRHVLNNNNEFNYSSTPTNSPSSSSSSKRGFGLDAGTAEGEMILASVEHKANSVDFPLSLRMLKRKKKKKQEWEEGEGLLLGESCCSVKKAFSSMVFMIRELHAYTLHMMEMIFSEQGMDLQGILARVRKEMHASFVWLFQHIFSSTPTLMVYVMILLANFTVYSMTITATTAGAAIAPPQPPQMMEATIATSDNIHHQQRFDPLSSIKRGRTASVGGSGRGGGKVRPVAGATDGGGDGRFEESFDRHRRTIFGDEMSSRVSSHRNHPAAAVRGEEEKRVEELKLWNSMLEEASRMGDVSLDHDTMQRFVSPVTVVMEPEDYTQYFWTELLYQRAVSEEPDNPLVLSNYAQFLYLVLHDLDRAEEMFERAVGVAPPDADSLSRYASFLWVARNDLSGAEEKFLEAIEADPTNSLHAANYAHFLWNTGGEDTCYPLTS